MTTNYYELPDISSVSKYEKIYILNNKTYNFIFQNNFRNEEINLMISYIDENENEIVLSRNICLYPNIDLINLLSEQYIDGKLYLRDITGNNLIPTYTDLSENYVLEYII